ncbi:hypothetical protein KJ632_05785 [Patescibacteria group bacterium]|nr:hypothetical protein [Patescibacteria group bacterium]
MFKKWCTYKGISDAGRLVAIISAILIIIGAFLPWISTAAGSSETGISGDGIITFVAGVLTLIFMFYRGRPHVFALLLGVISATVGITDMIMMSNAMEGINGSVGIGLYFTIIAGIGIFIGTTMEILRCKCK